MKKEFLCPVTIMAACFLMGCGEDYSIIEDDSIIIAQNIGLSIGDNKESSLEVVNETTHDTLRLEGSVGTERLTARNGDILSLQCLSLADSLTYTVTYTVCGEQMVSTGKPYKVEYMVNGKSAGLYNVGFTAANASSADNHADTYENAIEIVE